MQFRITTTILAILATAPPLPTTAQNTTLNFNCSLFSISAPFTNRTILSPTSLRISNATICPDNALPTDYRCRTRTYSGRIIVNATTNSSLIIKPSGLQNMLVRSLQARNTRVETTVFRNVAYALNESSKTFTIEPGKAGYAGFKPEMQCFTGVVETKSESCASGSVFDDGAREVQRLFDGKGLEFCIPLYRRRTAKPRRTEVRGKAGLVNVTREEASRPEMSVNPFRIVVDDEDDAPTGTSATPRPSVSRVSSTQRLDMSMFNVFVVILFMLVI